MNSQHDLKGPSSNPLVGFALFKKIIAGSKPGHIANVRRAQASCVTWLTGFGEPQSNKEMINWANLSFRGAGVYCCVFSLFYTLCA